MSLPQLWVGAAISGDTCDGFGNRESLGLTPRMRKEFDKLTRFLHIFDRAEPLDSY